jgi:hypothetical protein
LATVTQRLFDLGAEVGVVNDEFGDTGADKPLNVPHDERFTTRLQKGLGRSFGERAHAFAATRSENHRKHLRMPFTIAPSPAGGRGLG